MEVNICEFYHADTDNCGLAQHYEPERDFSEEELAVCKHVGCTYGRYKTAEIYLGEYQPNEMIDENGNVNWRLAFSMP